MTYITKQFLGLSEIVSIHAVCRPNDIAFVDGEERRSWRDFDSNVSRAAAALLGADVAKGDRVAVITGNSLWAYEVLFGVLRAGGVFTPFNTILTPQTIASLMEDSGARIVLVGAGYEALIKEAMTHMSNASAIRIIAEDTATLDNAESYDSFVSGVEGAAGEVQMQPEDACSMIYSSGTTGLPKGILHSHEGRHWVGLITGAGLRVHDQCRSLLATPPFTNGTWIFLIPTVLQGGTCIIMHKFEADLFYDILELERPTHVFLVPTQYGVLFDHPRIDEADFSSFVCLLSAGAPLPEKLKGRILERLGMRFFELWGLTEGVLTIMPPEEMKARPQSVGRAVLSNLKLIGDDDAEIVSGIGEIVGRSNALMIGYHKRPDATKDIEWRDDEGRLFIRTGDLGEFDDDGYLYIRGRKKDMIISGGLNIYPVDIESVLRTHIAVLDAAVIGAPHEKWGETPVAFVVVKQDASIDGPTLHQWANSNLSKFQRLSEIIIQYSDFPRNALGKVLKDELLATYTGKAGSGRF